LGCSSAAIKAFLTTRVGDVPFLFGIFVLIAATGTSNSNLVVADQLLKQLAGEYFSLLMEDSIKGVTKLDVVRVELGTSSLGTHIEKEFVPSLRGKADVERSLRGWSWDARGEYRLNDTVSAEAGASAKNFDDASEEDESEGRAKRSVNYRPPGS